MLYQDHKGLAFPYSLLTTTKSSYRLALGRVWDSALCPFREGSEADKKK